MAPEQATRIPAEDERRLVTVVFADVVGFTTMGEDLDPEQLKNLVANCFERLAADVTAHGGRVDKIMGDELVAMFGAPLAYGDDAERAVRAALQMIQTAATGPAVLELRVGVNTGEALVGQIRPGEYTAMGDVVNVGSRLKGLADPGSVVVGPMTHAATRSAISYEPLGPLETRGRREPVAAWRATGTIAPPGARSSRPKAPLVGRAEELSLLQAALAATARRRRAQLVVLLGDAGVGKTRLAEELADYARDAHRAVVLEGRCVPYGEANPWWPVAEALRDAMGISASDSATDSAAKSTALLSESLGVPGNHPDVKRLAVGLSFLMGDEQSLRDIDPARARDEGRRALRTLLSGMTRKGPAVVVLSELHWADALLLDQLGRLEGLHDLPLLLIGTARPELTERWQPPFAKHDVLVLHLGALDRESAEQLAAELLPESEAGVTGLLAERSGGNAFFLEELAALVSASEANSSELPATLRGILAARLDHLTPPERALLEDASVVGRDGEIEALVAMAAARGATDVASTLQRLDDRDLLDVGERTWQFRSNLVQEVAYETLTRAERARRHAGVAVWLAEHHHRLGRDDEEVETVAHHWSSAAELARGLGPVPGLPEDVNARAAEWLDRAMRRARQRELHKNGLGLVEHARALLDPDDVAGDHSTRLYRAAARAAVRDLAGARQDLEVITAPAEGRRPSAADMAEALTVLGDIEQKESRFERSVETLTRAVEEWRALGDRAGEAEALRLRGMTRVLSGNPREGQDDIAAALVAFRESGNRRGEAWALQALAWAAFSSGHAQECEERLDESQAAFTEIGDWGGLGWVTGLRAWLRYQQGDLDAAHNLASAVLPESKELGDDWATGMIVMLLASIQLWKGDPEAAIPIAEEARTAFRKLDDPINEMRVLGPLTRALLATGRQGEAAALFEEVWARARKTTYAAAEVFAALIDGTAAVHIGDVERAVRAAAIATRNLDDPVDEVGEPERLVLAGSAALMAGDAEAACAHLEEAGSRGSLRPNTAAWLSLARRAAGSSVPLSGEGEKWPDLSKGTYFDRVVAHLAAGFQGSPEDLEAAVEVADSTTDLVMQAVARLGRAIALRESGDPQADAVAADARRRLDSLGIAAKGWTTAFRLAASQ